MRAVYLIIAVIAIPFGHGAFASDEPNPARPRQGITLKPLQPQSCEGAPQYSCYRRAEIIDCETPLPILCVLDVNAAVPAQLSQNLGWTGGVFALSPKRRGADIASTGHAHKVCSHAFGPDWRTAAIEDGQEGVLKGHGGLADNSQNVWVDYKSRPEKTCWAK